MGETRKKWKRLRSDFDLRGFVLRYLRAHQGVVVARGSDGSESQPPTTSHRMMITQKTQSGKELLGLDHSGKLFFLFLRLDEAR